MRPIDEFESPRYLSKEVGSRYLIQHGGVADYALVAEGTDFGMRQSRQVRPSSRSRYTAAPQLYTPFAPNAEVNIHHPNAIIRAALLVPRLQEWARQYESVSSTAARMEAIVPKSWSARSAAAIPITSRAPPKSARSISIAG